MQESAEKARMVRCSPIFPIVLTDVGNRRQLSGPQKRSYIDAVLCLTDRNSTSGIAKALNRFDDHEAIHNSQTPNIHWVGHFLLWHRYFVATYEKALRTECGYSGGQPYVLNSKKKLPST